jgi:hypothetical protein
VLRVVLFAHSAHWFDVWHELDLCPSKNFSQSGNAHGTLRGDFFGKIAARNSKEKISIVLTRGKLIGQEGEEQAKRYIFVVRRKGKAGHCDVWGSAAVPSLHASKVCRISAPSTPQQFYSAIDGRYGLGSVVDIWRTREDCEIRL